MTGIDDQELMSIFSRAIGWQNFAATVASEAEVTEAEMETQLVQAKALVMIASWTGAKEDRVTLSRAHQEANPQVQAATAALHDARRSRKRTGVVRDNSERVANLVSRELSRRIGRDPVERRVMRWTP